MRAIPFVQPPMGGAGKTRIRTGINPKRGLQGKTEDRRGVVFLLWRCEGGISAVAKHPEAAF
jgi:hypothetical protein